MVDYKSIVDTVWDRCRKLGAMSNKTRDCLAHCKTTAIITKTMHNPVSPRTACASVHLCIDRHEKAENGKKCQHNLVAGGLDWNKQKIHERQPMCCTLCFLCIIKGLFMQVHVLGNAPRPLAYKTSMHNLYTIRGLAKKKLKEIKRN